MRQCTASTWPSRPASARRQRWRARRRSWWPSRCGEGLFPLNKKFILKNKIDLYLLMRWLILQWLIDLLSVRGTLAWRILQWRINLQWCGAQERGAGGALGVGRSVCCTIVCLARLGARAWARAHSGGGGAACWCRLCFEAFLPSGGRRGHCRPLRLEHACRKGGNHNALCREGEENREAGLCDSPAPVCRCGPRSWRACWGSTSARTQSSSSARRVAAGPGAGAGAGAGRAEGASPVGLLATQPALAALRLKASRRAVLGHASDAGR